MGGKHCLLFPAQLLHFALNQSVDKTQKQPQEQRPDPKKIPPSTVKALTASPRCCSPCRGHHAPGPMPDKRSRRYKIKAQRLWGPAEQKLQRSKFCTVINLGLFFSWSSISPRHMGSPQQRWGRNHLSRRPLWHYQTPALTVRQPVFPYTKWETARLTETQIKRLKCLLLNKSDVRQESLTRD